MREHFLPTKNSAQENVVTPENLRILEEPKQGMEQERSEAAAEAHTDRMDQVFEKIETTFAQMEPDERAYVEHGIETTDDGKRALSNLQEKATHLLSIGHHATHELSEKYNPKIVKTIGRLGKIIGGLGGALAGHGIASAGGAVVGSKLGEYGALKTFEKVANKLPQSWQERIKKPEDAIQIQKNQEMIQDKISQLEIADATLESLSNEIENLTPEQRERFNQLMEQDTKTASVAERLKNAYSKYGEFCEHFEKKYPIFGTAAEFAIHASVGPILEGMELGKGAIHAIEMLVTASGGTENLTAHFLHAFDTMKNAGTMVSRKIQELAGRTGQTMPLAA